MISDEEGEEQVPWVGGKVGMINAGQGVALCVSPQAVEEPGPVI